MARELPSNAHLFRKKSNAHNSTVEHPNRGQVCDISHTINSAPMEEVGEQGGRIIQGELISGPYVQFLDRHGQFLLDSPHLRYVSKEERRLGPLHSLAPQFLPEPLWSQP